MSENIPPMPEPTTPSKGKPKIAAPEFVFVENTRTSLFTLRWRPDRGAPFQAGTERKFLGPGLNAVAKTIVEACTPKGHSFEASFSNVLVRRDPLTMAEHEAIALASRTSSRQACHAWLKIETRSAVKAALRERLAPKPTTDVVDDDDE